MSDSRYSNIMDLLAETTQLLGSEKTIVSSDPRLRIVFNQSPLSIQIVDSVGKTIMVNPAWKKLWGISDEYLENHFFENYNILEDPVLESYGLLGEFKKAFLGQVVELPELIYDLGVSGNASGPRFIKTYIYPVKDKQGVVREVILIHSDVTENRSLALKQRFLGNLASILLETLDFEETLKHFSQVVIPYFCDACYLDLYQDGEMKCILSKHKDHKIEKIMTKIHLNFLKTKDSKLSTHLVLEKGEPLLIEKTSEQFHESLCDENVSFEDVKVCNIQSQIAIPLKIRSETIGVISFFLGENRRHFDKEDLNFAIEVGWLVSLAIDNSKLYQEAKQAITLREDFISVASHELKTPLTSIKLQLDVLTNMIKDFGDGAEFQKLNDVAKISNKQIDRLTNLIEAMLDMTRLSKSNVNLSMQRTDLGSIVEDVISRFKEQFSIQNIVCTFDHLEPCWILCDPLRMEQVISNLINNAIKYGKNSPIRIKLEKKDDKIILSVKDRGIGIKSGDHLKIFERFQRGKNVNFTAGLGLGLYIVKEIVDAHAGRIWVESEVGQETSFYVEFRKI